MTLEDIYEELKTKEIHDRISFTHKIKTKNKSISMSIGRVWFNLLTPDDYPLIDEQIDNKKVRFIIDDVYNKYDCKISSAFITKLNKEAFVLGTITPDSFDINALVIPQFIIDKKKELFSNPNLNPNDINKISFDLAKEYLDYVKKEYGSGIYNILMSGAKGSPSDWALLMIAKGAQVDIEGNISKPIFNSLDDGLNIEEFYNAAGNARSTLYTKTKGSAEPGYLATQTVFANSNLMLSGDDCGTTKFFKLFVTSTISTTICGRYYENDKTQKLTLIELDNVKKLINTTIRMRSPLYCIQKDGICKTCYGKLAEALNTKKIGMLTAATVNDQGITTAMKSRHKASQLSIQKANFLKDIMVS